MGEKSSVVIRDSVSDRIIELTEDLVVKQGVKAISVSMLMKKLGMTNRVFYNRFRNIEEVLNIVYKKVVLKMRDNITAGTNPRMNYYEYVEKLIVMCMEDTYDLKNQFSQYMFEHDSLSKDNYEWWIKKIKELINYGIENGYLKENLNADDLSYFIWCFCRGCNLDAVMRNISKEDAVRSLKAGFKCFLEGAKKKYKI